MDTNQSSNSPQFNLTFEKKYLFPKMPKNHLKRDIGKKGHVKRRQNSLLQADPRNM